MHNKQDTFFIFVFTDMYNMSEAKKSACFFRREVGSLTLNRWLPPERADPGNVGHASGVQNDPGSVVLST